MSPLQALLQSLVHSKPSSALRGMLKASTDVHLQKFAMPLATEKDLISTSHRSLATKSNYYAKGTYMDKDLVTQRVLEMVKAVQKVDPHKVSPTARFSRDLGLDSLDTVELLMGLEVEFGLEIPNREADKFVCSADAVNFIASHPRTVASKPKPSHK